MNNEWEYYNHALVPTLPPHIDPDTSWMKDSAKWKEYAGGKTPLFARWVSDFDCSEETEWWCIIKDTPFDIMSLKSNRRTEEFKKLTRDNLGNSEYLGAFLKDTDTMIGYAIYNLFDDWIEYSVVKTDPEYLNTQVNAALAYFGVERYMRPGIKYIHGGWRTMIHESNYQEYLLKNFEFRKAYCKLHIQYRPLMKLAVNVLYPFRGIIKKFSKNKLIYQVWCTMRQEEIHRTFR